MWEGTSIYSLEVDTKKEIVANNDEPIDWHISLIDW